MPDWQWDENPFCPLPVGLCGVCDHDRDREGRMKVLEEQRFKDAVRRRQKAVAGAARLKAIVDEENEKIKGLLKEAGAQSYDYVVEEPVLAELPPETLGWRVSMSKGREPSRKVDAELLLLSGVPSETIEKCTRVGKPGEPYVVVNPIKVKKGGDKGSKRRNSKSPWKGPKKPQPDVEEPKFEPPREEDAVVEIEFD